MALNKQQIKSSVNDLINDTKSLNQKEAQEAFADKLSDIIISAIKSATVTVNAGIPVSTSGGAGATSGPGSGSLN